MVFFLKGEMKEKFYILAIDGGGYRGVYSAHILKRIEDEFGSDWLKRFNLIAGTSTGAIIAAALACGLSAEKIEDFYRQHGQRIFQKRLFCPSGILGSQYDNRYLKKVLKDTYGDSRKLGQIEIPLILPTTDIGIGCVHVLKSSYDKEFYRDKNRLVYEAVLASCSAPTYFDPYFMDTYLLADGGLWANNPSLVAIVDAKRRLGQTLDSLKILSIGTGEGREFYSQADRWWRRFMGWGFLTRWGGSKFIDMLLNLQSQTTNNMVGLLLEQDQIVRINFKSDEKLKLDDPKEHKNLISLADNDFTHNAQKIKDFLGYKTGGQNGIGRIL